MIANVGGTDRIIRILLGIVLTALAATHVVTGGLAITAYVVGGIALVTGAIRYCGAYPLLGISTCPLKPGQSK
jgi:Protein of unknown function (DUF2892)